MLRFLLLLTLAVQLCSARPKTDIVTLANGDEITCEIRRLNRGVLAAKTDSLSDISIRWEDVTRIRSEGVFEIILSDATTHFGPMAPGPDKNILLAGEPPIPLLDIVELIPIGSRVINRLSGSADFGYSFQKSDTTTQLNFDGALVYTARRRSMQSRVSSTLISREGSATTQKNQAGLALNEKLPKGYFALALGEFSTNSQLNLIQRYLGGGGLGRYLMHTNRSIVALYGGSAFSIERYTGEERHNNAEALLGANTQVFRLFSPKLDITGDVRLWPNLTTSGRFRIDVNVKARIEIHKGIFLSVQFLDNYDRKNPTTSAPLNDYGVVMSLGYSFNR